MYKKMKGERKREREKREEKHTRWRDEKTKTTEKQD